MFEVTGNFKARATAQPLTSFQDQRRAVINDMLWAQRDALTAVSRGLEKALGDDVRRSGVSFEGRRKPEDLYTVNIYPERRLAYNQAALVKPAGSSAENLLESWEIGPKVAALSGGWLAIPLPATMGLLGNGRASRKELYQRAIRRFGDPRLLPTASGNLLAMFPVSVTRAGRIGSGTRRAAGGQSRSLRDDAHFVPMFVLAREVQMRARTRARQIMASAGQKFPQDMAEALARRLAEGAA